MNQCTICGKECAPRTDKCLKCSKLALMQTFKENPELGKAFKAAIEQMQKEMLEEDVL